MYAIMGYFNNQKIILMPQFFSIVDNHSDRDFHSHNCIEMSYILSGTANHILVLPDGKTEQKKLCQGNYMILDSTARHAYKNGSSDFKVMNVLFKMPFLFQSAANKRGMNSTKAFSVTRSEWNEDPLANDIELKFGLNKPITLGNRKYIRIWLDLKGDREKIDFSNARIGLIADNDLSRPYCPEGFPKTPFYFLGEGEDNWSTLYLGNNGCFGAEHDSSVYGRKGWFAFPIECMVQKSTGKRLDPESVVTGVYFYYAMSDKKMAGNHLYIDDIALAEDYLALDKGFLTEDRIVDFDSGVIRASVTGKDGAVGAEIHTEQIKLSIFDEGDMYEHIKGIYPDFKYSDISGSPVNQVYFDRDGSVRPLFQICYDSSRKHMQEWQNTVRHALSLIIIISLNSFDEQIRPQKENIMEIIRKYVEKHYTEDITLTEICAKHFYSLPYVSHKFKETFKCSFEQYVRQLRIHRACELLLSTQMSVSEIAEKCGYTSVRSFRKAFNCIVEKSPLEFRKSYNK